MDWTLIIIAFSALTLIVIAVTSRWQQSEDPIRLSMPKWRAPNLMKRLDHKIAKAGMLGMTPSLYLTITATIAVIASLVTMLIFRSFPPALLVPPFVAFGAWFYLGRQERQRTLRMSQEIVPFMWKMYSALKARGSHRLALEEALMGGSGGEIRDWRDTDTPLMCQALRPLLRRLASQEPLDTALPTSLDLVQTSGWERLVRRLMIYEERGGDMPTILKQAIDDENRNMRVQAELQSAYIKVVRDQRLITVGSIILLPAAHFMMGGLLTPLFKSILGWLILFIGTMVMLGGIYYGQRTVRSIEEDIDF
jgi:Flp pilus assembly protein TadB